MSAQKRRSDRREQAPEQAEGRTTAEWVTLAVSLLIALTVVGLLVYDFVAVGNDPPLIHVEPDYSALRQEEGHYYLPITVTNQGGQTAEDVTIHFVLQPPDSPSESTDVTIRFMAPGERAAAALIFRTNPATGTLYHTSNYLEP